MTSFEDKTLTCQDCGQPFVFSADDQAFHETKGFTNEPKRLRPLAVGQGAMSAVADLDRAHVRCTPWCVPNVAKIPPSRSSLAATAPSTAANASVSGKRAHGPTGR